MSPSPLARFAGWCLLALALAMPLVPQATEALQGGKHVIYLLLAGLGMACLALDALGRRAAPALGTPVDIALLVFMAAALPSLAASSNPGMSRYTLGLLLATTLTYVLAVKAIRTPRDVLRLYGGALLASLVIAGFGLFAYRDFLAQDLPEVRRSGALAGPFFVHSYLAAQYLVMVFTGALVLVFERGLSRGWRLAVTLALLPLGAYLLVIGSRGAYLAIAAALVVHLVLRVRGAARAQGRGSALSGLLLRAGLFLAAGLALLLVATATNLLPDALHFAVDRVLLVLDPQASDFNFSRLRIWRDTLRMSADHLVLGVGPGAYDSVLPAYHASSRTVPHAHNQFLHVLAEGGLLGLIAFLFLLRHALHAARRGAAHLVNDEERRAPFHAAVAALAAAGVYFLFETPLDWAEAGSLIMILLAVMTRAGCDSRERAGRPVLALAGLLAGAAVLGLVWPEWLRYDHSAALMTASVRTQAEARALDAAGKPETARNRWELALDEAAQADRWFPHRAEFQGVRADMFLERNRPEEALTAARIADARSPGTYHYLSAMGLSLLRLKRPLDALDPLRRAISASREPEALETYVLLGRALYALGRYEEAWYVFSSLLGSDYDVPRPDLLLDAARTLINLDRNLAVARQLLLRLQQRGGGDPQYVAQLIQQVDDLIARPRRQIPR
jgi:putative inorganic carbon (hco3(-)) transporter